MQLNESPTGRFDLFPYEPVKKEVSRVIRTRGRSEVVQLPRPKRRAAKTQMSLIRVLLHTEIFSKRRKIFSSSVKEPEQQHRHNRVVSSACQNTHIARNLVHKSLSTPSHIFCAMSTLRVTGSSSSSSSFSFAFVPFGGGVRRLRVTGSLYLKNALIVGCLCR